LREFYQPPTRMDKQLGVKARRLNLSIPVGSRRYLL
jgi:hypothetical protein